VKKSKVNEPEPDAVIKSTYANSRIKQLTKNGANYLEFIYDKTNNLVTSKNMGTKFSPEFNSNVQATLSFTNYVYDTNGKVVSAASTVNTDVPAQSVHDYAYSNGRLESDTYSDLTSNGTKTLVNTIVYTYQNGQVHQVIIKDSNGTETSTRSYTYTTIVNGELQMNVPVTPASASAFDATYTYYTDVFDPSPLNLPGLYTSLPLMVKSCQSSAGSTGTRNVTYKMDNDGKIISYTDDYPNKTEFTAKYVYTYEPKQ
jgi:hypothetical protein